MTQLRLSVPLSRSRRTTLVCRLLSLLLLSSSTCLFGQSRSDLEKKQDALLKEIATTSRLLDKNKSMQSTSLNKLDLLNKKIRSQAALYKNYQKQIVQNEVATNRIAKEIAVIESNLGDIRKNYSSLLTNAYRQKLQHNNWLFLLSANGLNEMWRRWQYISRIRDAWKKRAANLLDNQSQLEIKTVELATEKAAKAKLSQTAGVLLKQQEGDKRKLEGVLSDYKKDESSLVADLKKKESERKKLLAAIEKIISAELASAPENLPNTPMGRIATSFKASKGALPWPVEKGVVTKYFGSKRHPLLPNVTTSSNGIDIKTTAGATIRAVFAGKVISVQAIPGYDQVVIVQHGTFYSVYSYLSKSNVYKNEELSVGDRIGRARQSDNNGEVHFEIWSGKEIQDPLLWLNKR